MKEHHKFNELIKDISAERQAKIEEKTAQLKQKIALTELQQAFLEKHTEATATEHPLEKFMKKFGAWEDDRTDEEIITEIYDSRK